MFRACASIILATLGAAKCLAQGCQPFWNGLAPKGVGSMVAFDSGSGPEIYTSGFAVGAPPYTDPPLRWDGHSFVAVGAGWRGDDIGLKVLNLGTGSSIHSVSVVDGAGHRKMFRLEGPKWVPTPEGVFVNPFPFEGSFITPEFTATKRPIAGLYGLLHDSAMNRVVRWEADHWKALGGTSSGNFVGCLAEFDVQGRSNLIVSGGFTDFGGVPVHNISRWDGDRWHPMGDAPGGAMEVISWDDGTGPSLYIGWIPEDPEPPQTREGIARWTGTQWVSVGGGLYQAVSGGGSAREMAVFDDGTGPALFVLGRFDRAGGPSGIPARNIAKWDGSQWHALGAGVGGFPNHLAVADDGRGPSLFVEGNFSSVGGGTARSIAQWVGCKGNRQCYADCDNNRHLNANDFQCFLNKYAAKDPYANCDVSTQAPAINAADFQCYLNKFAAGCP